MCFEYFYICEGPLKIISEEAHRIRSLSLHISLSILIMVSVILTDRSKCKPGVKFEVRIASTFCAFSSSLL